GSVSDTNFAGVVSGRPVVAWVEQTFGNLPQVYMATWDGSTWNQSPSAAPALSVGATVQEALYPGGTSGVARTGEPFTLGIPIPDSAGIASLSSFGLTGASAGQFMVEASWPATGNIKWLKARGSVPSLSAGSAATVTLTNSGSGDFGGSALAADNGATI